MDANLEISRTKLTATYLAINCELPEAEKLLNALRETVTFLERRIAREKSEYAKKTMVISEART